MTTPSIAAPEALSQLAGVLEARRFPLAAEKALQSAIAEAFTCAGIAFEREHRFSARDVVDFWCPPVAVEVKLQGRKRAIYRQCERYCAHEAVEALILATAFPLSLERLSKPARVVHLGRAWL